jgi:predicted RNase H-like nuclease (RuvC/YqgF family)
MMMEMVIETCPERGYSVLITHFDGKRYVPEEKLTALNLRFDDNVHIATNRIKELELELHDAKEKNKLLIRQIESTPHYKSLDITGSEGVEVKVRHDGTVLWVNTVEGGCVLRICKIKSIVVEDERRKKS